MEMEEDESSDSPRSPSAVLHAREVARRTLEGEVDVPVADLCGIGTDDKKSLPTRAAKQPARTTQPARAGRESWESWETDVRRSTSSDESVSKVGLRCRTHQKRTHARSANHRPSGPPGDRRPVKAESAEGAVGRPAPPSSAATGVA